MPFSPEQRVLRAALRNALGQALREFWQREENEPLSQRLTELLGQIDRGAASTAP
jgi:hypothetical protein